MFNCKVKIIVAYNNTTWEYSETVVMIMKTGDAINILINQHSINK